MKVKVKRMETEAEQYIVCIEWNKRIMQWND